MATWPDGSRLLKFILDTVDLPDTQEGTAKATMLILAFEAMKCDTLPTLTRKTIQGKTWPKVFDRAYDEQHPPVVEEESVLEQPDTIFVEPPT